MRGTWADCFRSLPSDNQSVHSVDGVGGGALTYDVILLRGANLFESERERTRLEED